MALPLLLNFSLYKRDHMIHHKHQGTGKDSETILRIHSVKNLISSSLMNTHFLDLWKQSLTLTFRSKNKNIRKDGITVLLVSAILIVATAMSPFWLLLLFWLPFFLSVVIDAIIGLPEHAVIGDAYHEEVPTRDLSAGRIGNFLLFWVSHHKAHHLQPSLSGPDLNSGFSTTSYASFYVKAFKTLSSTRVLSARSLS